MLKSMTATVSFKKQGIRRKQDKEGEKESDEPESEELPPQPLKELPALEEIPALGCLGLC